MKCFHCGLPIPASVALEVNESGDPRRGLFHCPSCDASHLRERVGQQPDGIPIYQFRLWGHPATTRRRVQSPGAPPKSPSPTVV